MHDIFCFTDIHGMYDLYKAIMNYCHEQDPEAMIIFCGDACDRGPAGYKIMHELLENPHVVYLKGNHEDMFVKAAREIPYNTRTREEVQHFLSATRGYNYKYLNIQQALNNGAMDTLTDWVMDGMNMAFVDQIEKLPLTFSTDVCDFCHAAGVYRTFASVADNEYNNFPVPSYFEENLLWSRSAMNYGWKPGRTAVFGHTPVPCLDDFIKMNWPKEINIQPYMWCGDFDPEMTGKKLDMDTGAVFTGDAYVLNVLTMKAQGFEDIDILSKENRTHNVKKIDCIQF